MEGEEEELAEVTEQGCGQGDGADEAHSQTSRQGQRYGSDADNVKFLLGLLI